MRILAAILVVFAGAIGYGVYRQHAAQVQREARAVALQDSLRRLDSLQRVAAAEAAWEAQLQARKAAALAAAARSAQTRAERPKPLKLEKPKTRVVIIRKPTPTNRRP